ncbi:MAG: DUF6361 family protein, partial [Actinomycetes bacterium]
MSPHPTLDSGRMEARLLAEPGGVMSLSTFTWLDYDEAQAKRSAELIRSLSDPETIDSIGIGSIRDGMAGLLFPGTSTIQTRVRYFLLVPWAMQHVTARRPRSKAGYKGWLLDA